MSQSYPKPGDAVANYNIVEEIGRGTNGIVYRAIRDGKYYGLKIMLQQDQDRIDSSLRFRKEAAFVARLRHPGLVRVYDIGEFNTLPFIVMDFVEGRNFESLVESGQKLNTKQFVTLIKTVAGALEEMHKYHLIHRDIKPGNLMLCTDGSVKLLDLGLAGDIEELQSQGREKEFVGTLLYSAPEQIGILKRPIDGRTDLYSLGVSAYQLITGRLPFAGSQVSEILQQLATVRPPAPKSVVPDLSPAISGIIEKLIEKDPDDRYQTSAGLIYDLERIEQLDSLANQGQPLKLGEFDQTQRHQSVLPLLGRENELALLRQNWQQALAGKGNVILIEGEGGSGKSRLAQEIVQDAAEKRSLVLTGKCNSIGSSVPLAFLRETFDDYCNQILKLPELPQKQAIEKLRTAAGEGAGVISRLSLGLEQLLGKASDDIMNQDALALQELFYKEIRRFIVDLSRAFGSLLLKIDDIQWMDQATKELLEGLSEEISKSPVMLILTSRNDAESQDNLMEVRDRIGSKYLQEISLQPLKAKAVGDIAKAYLGGEGLDETVIEKLTAVTNGNPFAVGEYLGSLLSMGHLQIRGGLWVVDSVGLSELSISRNVYELILSRVKSLKQEVLEVVSIAAVIGNRFELNLLISAHKNETAVMKAIQDALKNNLIETVDNETYRYQHDRIREAIISNLSADRLKEINDVLALALEKQSEKTPDQLFQLARFYSSGLVQKYPGRVFETNLAAGLVAADNYAFDQAHELFNRAQSVLKIHQPDQEQLFKLHEAYGTCCMNSGRLDEAHSALNQALNIAQNEEQRTRILHVITRTYSSEGKIIQAWDMFKQSLVAIGKPYPTSPLPYLFTMLWYVFITYVLYYTKIGYGRLNHPSRAKERDRQRLIFEIYETSYINAYLRGNPLDLTQITFRQFYLAHFLGDSAEMAKSHIAAAMVFGLFCAKPIMNMHRRKALEIATNLRDPAVLAFVHTRESYSVEFSGNTRAGEKLAIDCLPDVKKYLGSWVYSQHVAELTHQYMNRGYWQTAAKRTLESLPELDKTNNYTFMANQRGLLYLTLPMVGRASEVHPIHEQWKGIFEKVKDAKYAAGYGPHMILGSMYFNQEFGSQTEEHIEKFLKYGIEDYHYKLTFAFIAYIRAHQFERAAGTPQEAEFRKKYKIARLNLGFRAMTPVFRCHYHVVRAMGFRIDGKYKKALKALAVAEVQATEADSIWCHITIAKERAKIHALTGNETRSGFEIQTAYQITRQQGFSLWKRQLEQEFKITSSSETHISESKSGAAGSRSAPAGNKILDKRTMDALLQVSLASSSTMDPMEQARKAMDEIVRVLGAERAYVFLWDDGANQLNFQVGRNSKQEDLKNLEGYSSTVVKNVMDSRKPLVVTGSEQMEAIGSKSAVISDLRSIMAAPLFLKDQFKGVIYVDSRIAKGLFTESDSEILQAIANHIAIAVESAKMAQMEVVKTSLAKDLEVSAAVQRLFLPRHPSFSVPGLELNGFYRPASQCGGDWWWYKTRRDKKVAVIVADVTGHGAGPAMITASIASCFRILGNADEREERPLPELINMVHKELHEWANSEFALTLFAAEIDTANMSVRYWSAGAPSPFIFGKDGQMRKQLYVPSGSPLGLAGFSLGEGKSELEAGDRLLIYTDGLTEMRLPNGNQLGERRFTKMVTKLSSQPGDQANTNLIAELDELRGAEPQDDDFTSVVIDIVKSG